MTIATDNSFRTPAPGSEIDRRAIGVFGHLLLAGVWLECQFKNAPRPRISWSSEPGVPETSGRNLPANVVPITQPRNEKR
ncbi:MAG TPA: hypothetical protein VG014_10105 [Acidimicrobiales bacterium]|jgi:hypothetical protein|nr:hypothetical protein [Acidimicrobiales bacterium]